MEQAERERTDLDEVRWELAYDRASIDRFAAQVEAERRRLLAEIEAAEARVSIAKSGIAARQAEERVELGSLVLLAQAELAQIEREHHEIVSAIRAAADVEVNRVLDAARAEAAAVRDAAAAMEAVLNGGSTPDTARIDLDALGAELPGLRASLDAG